MDNLTIVVPFYNGRRHIDRLLESIPAEIPVLVVDDVSTEPLQPLRKYKNATVIRLEEKGYFAGAVNAGIDACETDVLILNQDVWFKSFHWLDLIAEKRSRYAMIGEGVKGTNPAWPRGYIHGTFMFIRRDAWNAVGPMNAVDYPLWGSTCEWQLRMCRKGYSALPIGKIHGFEHTRGDEHFGDAISSILKKEPHKKGLFIRIPPAISVVVNCFNYGRYLSDAVGSLVGGLTSLGDVPGQTFQSFEVIIVDDNSQDTTERIGRELADPWKGIRYIRRNRNGGTPAANNTGIRAAHGRAISMLCADDMMAPTRLEKLYRALEKNPHSMIYDDMRIFGDGEWLKVRGRFNAERSSVWHMMEPYDFDRLLEKNGIHSGIMFTKKAWQDIGGYNETMRDGREDWQVNVALGLEGYCGIHVREPLYLYRREGQNRTLRNTTPFHQREFQLQMQRLYPEVYRGVMPKMCCGRGRSRRSAPPPPAAPAVPQALAGIGAEGLLKLEYVGRSAGTQTWWGEHTRQKYIFGGKRTVGYVDKRDAPAFLKVKEAGQFIFKEIKEVIPKPAQESEFVPEEQEEEHLPPPPLPVLDPSTFTVAQLEWNLSHHPLSRNELIQMLKTEEAGKARKGAIKILKETLNALDD